MKENINIIRLFPTQAINGERLVEVFNVFEAETKLQPEKWGHNERIRQIYNKEEIVTLVQEGIKTGKNIKDLLFLYRNKKLKYNSFFSTRQYPGTFFDFVCKDKVREEEQKLIFELGDHIANIVKPIFGTTHILFVESRIEQTMEYELLEICGQPYSAEFRSNGPFGVGLRTYFGEQLIEMFGRDFLMNTPAHVVGLEWGGIRIDLVEEPWKIDETTLMEKWKEVMAYLGQKDLFAKYEIREDGTLGGRPTPGRLWNRNYIEKQEISATSKAVDRNTELLTKIYEHIEQNKVIMAFDAKGIQADYREFEGLKAKGMRAGKGSFKASIFSDTTIIDCELDGANFEDSNMEGIQICDSFLDHANFKGVNLKRATINISQACGICFDEADLTGATIEGTDFNYSTFKKAKLVNVNADDSSFRGADLTDADLSGGSFIGADFRGAKLLNVKWDGAKLDNAIWDEK